jgi:aminoglycoside phosphotransferase (APT) family kinase protein
VFPGEGVEAAELLHGGFANANYKVLLSGREEPLIVRVYVRDAAAATREAAVMHLVRGDVPVPDVLHVESGTDGLPPYAVLQWVEGVTLDRLLSELDPPSAMRATRAVGRVLAKLQRFRLPTVGPSGGRDGAEASDNIGQPSLLHALQESLFERGGREQLGARLAARLWRFVNGQAQALREVEQHSMLVHGDFNPLNVIMQRVDGEAKVGAVIDWEYAHSGTPLLDLGSMLRCERDQPDWFEAELVAGYLESGGILPSGWRDVSRAVDLINLCGLFGSPNAGEVARRSVQAVVESTLTIRRSGREGC